MQPPVEHIEAVKLTRAVKVLAGVAPHEFDVLIGWFRSELAKRDRENRTPGKENMTSEAHALQVVIDHVAACIDADTDGSEATASGEQPPNVGT